MRSDPIQFALANSRANRKPRFVIKIEYDVNSPYLTSHADITSVPGDVIQSVVERPSSVSQRIYPDEGRSEIGSFTFTVVDKDKQLTEALRAQLEDENAGIRGKKVKFYIGYKGLDFSAFVLFTTQIVTGISYRQGLYTVRCADITREQRQKIFEPVSTTLIATISATDTTIVVNDASKFVRVAHGPSFSDAPNVTVGYLRIEDEIIRYADQPSSNVFTNCTRGVFNTRAAEHAIDPGTAITRRTKVEEFIYLEMPGPKLAYAVLTGSHGSVVLPDHWHLGIDTSLIRLADFTGIGLDLWNSSNDADPACFIFRFDGLKEQDGKRFLEKEIYLLLGCFSPVYADGTLGLKRRVPVIADAASVVTLTEHNVVSMGELVHDLSGMHNVIRVDWGYDEIQDEYIRKTVFVDEESVARHRTSDELRYEFRGLHSQRAGDSTIGKRLDSMRDAYNEPPIRLPITVLGSLNGLEVGDIARVKVPETILRDFTSNPGQYNRSHEIQQRTYDAFTGDVTLQTFGSTSRPLTISLGENTANLPDAFYNSSGTALNSVITITSGTMATGSHTLTGNASLTASGAIYYYLGDLTIPQGANITISANVQLRVRGFLTLNGTINGVGGGKAGVSDPGTGSWDATFAGNPGFIGNSRGYDGVEAYTVSIGRVTIIGGRTIPAVKTVAANSVFPEFNLSVAGNSLLGLPDDLRGTGGAPGGRLISTNLAGSHTIVAAGGAGANGGAGLCIVCRGMALGASASITLDGANSASTSSSVMFNTDVYPGVGGAGGPGAFLLLLDGDFLSVPEISAANFSAKTGTAPQLGNAMPVRDRGDGFAGALATRFLAPVCGFADPEFISGADHSASARLPMYIPPTDNPAEDDLTPPAPSNLTASHVAGGNMLTFTIPDLDYFDVIEIYASIDNDRTNAEPVGEVRGNSYFHRLPLGGLRYYWIRSKINPANGRAARVSAWHPGTSTAGQSSNNDSPGETPDAPDDFTFTPKVNGIQFYWSLPAYARLLGQLQLYEGTSPTPFGAATKVWEGYALGYFLPKTNTITRYYWLVLNRSGELSVPNPPVVGIAASALSVTSTLTANALPTSLSKTANVEAPPGTAVTAPTSVTATAGTPAYTYAWTWFTGGGGITIGSPTAATTTFSATHNFDGTILTGTARCTVTDSVGATATADVSVQLFFPSIA